ncbi:MAG: hypothetical protein ABEJ65_12555, partial [bacterium]
RSRRVLMVKRKSGFSYSDTWKGKMNRFYRLITGVHSLFLRQPQLACPLLLTISCILIVEEYALRSVNWEVILPIVFTSEQMIIQPIGPGIILSLIALAFVFLFAQSLLITYSGSVTMEYLKDLQSSGEASLVSVVIDTVKRNFRTLFPLACTWAIYWFFMEFFKSDTKSRLNDPTTYTGTGLFELFRNGSELALYMVIPAVVWERDGLNSAVRRAREIRKKHLREMKFEAISRVGSLFALAPVIYMVAKFLMGVPFYETLSNSFGYFVIYESLVFIYCTYLHQMMAGYLYCWHKNWEAEAQRARENNHPVPPLEEVPRPDFMHDPYKSTG